MFGRRLKNIVLFASLALNAVLIYYFVDRRIKFQQRANTQQPAEKWADLHNIGRVSIHDQFPINPGDVVLVGNSLTEWMPSDMLPGVKNRGIASNETSHIVGRIQKIAQAQPKKIFLEAGTNDFRESSIPVDSVFKNYQEVIRIIRQNSPRTEIYVQSVFPTSKSYGFYNDSIVKLNNKLKSLQLPYLDVYSKLVLQGQLNDAFTYDGIHLNYNGYKTWIDMLRPYISDSAK
jgi:lysophospholipase L1-like esterase